MHGFLGPQAATDASLGANDGAAKRSVHAQFKPPRKSTLSAAKAKAAAAVAAAEAAEAAAIAAAIAAAANARAEAVRLAQQEMEEAERDGISASDNEDADVDAVTGTPSSQRPVAEAHMLSCQRAHQQPQALELPGTRTADAEGAAAATGIGNKGKGKRQPSSRALALDPARPLTISVRTPSDFVPPSSSPMLFDMGAEQSRCTLHSVAIICLIAEEGFFKTFTACSRLQ